MTLLFVTVQQLYHCDISCVAVIARFVWNEKVCRCGWENKPPVQANVAQCVRYHSNQEPVEPYKTKSGSPEWHWMALAVRKLSTIPLLYCTSFVFMHTDLQNLSNIHLPSLQHKTSFESNRLVWKYASFLSLSLFSLNGKKQQRHRLRLRLRHGKGMRTSAQWRGEKKAPISQP